MNINSAFQSGLLGIQNGTQRLNKVAGEIAGNGTSQRVIDPVKMTESIVELHEAERNIQASAKVIKMGDGMLGTLLDMNV